VTLPAGGFPPPLKSSSGQGTWIRKAGQTFTDTTLFFIYDAAGQFIATLKVHQNLTVNATGDEYNGNSSFDVFDPAGNLIPGFSGCSTVHGQRINVEPPNACP